MGWPTKFRAVEQGGLLRLALRRCHGDKTDTTFCARCDAWRSDAFAGWSIVQQLPAVEPPVPALQGEDDRYDSAAQPDAIERAVRRPLIEGCGHAPHREAIGETLRRVADLVASP